MGSSGLARRSLGAAFMVFHGPTVTRSCLKSGFIQKIGVLLDSSLFPNFPKLSPEPPNYTQSDLMFRSRRALLTSSTHRVSLPTVSPPSLPAEVRLGHRQGAGSDTGGPGGAWAWAVGPSRLTWADLGAQVDAS